MEYAAPIIGLAVVAFLVWAAVASSKRRREQQDELVAEARAFLADVQQNHALPIVDTHLILKPGEVAFYSASSTLSETRAVRHYQSGFTGFRVARGMYVGGSSGRATSTQEWSEIDAGCLTITSKRLVFDGGGQDRTVPLSKIVSVQSNPTGIELSVDGRQKAMVFSSANPIILAAIIRICCQASDPRDLSQTNLNIV